MVNIIFLGKMIQIKIIKIAHKTTHLAPQQTWDLSAGPSFEITLHKMWKKSEMCANLYKNEYKANII